MARPFTPPDHSWLANVHKRVHASGAGKLHIRIRPHNGHRTCRWYIEARSAIQCSRVASLEPRQERQLWVSHAWVVAVGRVCRAALIAPPCERSRIGQLCLHTHAIEISLPLKVTSCVLQSAALRIAVALSMTAAEEGPVGSDAGRGLTRR